MEAKLSPAVWEKMVQASPDMFCTFDLHGNFTYVSNASNTILGYSSDELLGHNYAEFLHPDYTSSTRAAIQNLVKGTSINDFQNAYIHKDGSTVILQWSAAWTEETPDFLCVARDITELATSRQMLQEREQLYKTLFENNPDILFIQDAAGLVKEVNQSFCDIFGISREEALNRPTTSFLPPEMVPVCIKYFQESLSGNSTRYDLELITASNERRIYDVVKFPIILGGEVTYIKTILKDITPIVRSYDKISRQAHKLNTIFESITNGFITFDKSWNFTYINKEATRLLSLAPQHLIGKSIWQEYPEELNGEFYQQCYTATQTGKAVHFESYCNRNNIWIEVRAFPSTEGLSVYFDDITEKVQARQELEKLSLVASKTNNSVLIADKDWKIEWVNDGFTRLMGYSMQEALGKKPSELLHNHKTDRKPYELLEGKLLAGEPISLEALNIKKGGVEVWVNIDITAIFNEQGELIRFVEVHTDITALKQSELELSQLAKDLYRQNSDLQQFNYIVSHNLRAPVANVIGLTRLLTNSAKNPELFNKSLFNLQQSVLKLDTVLKDVNNILSIRDNKGNIELEQVNLKAVVQQVVSSLQEPLQNCKAILVTEIEEELSIRANKAYLYSIFYNLLSNAIKYKSSERTPEISIKCYINSNNGILLTFSDNGLGFDMSVVKDKIFKLYKRFHKDKKGRGIGLYLVKSHLEALGGHVEVSSQPGLGTKFLIYLPKNEHENFHH